MAHHLKDDDKPEAKAAKPAPVKAATVDELADALRALVTSAHTEGGRDRAEVSRAHELLERHDAASEKHDAKHSRD